MQFTDHDLDSAPAASRPFLKATLDQSGFLPVAMRRLAASPPVLDAFARLNAIWAKGVLDAREREVVVFTVAHHAGCELCLAFHNVLLAGEPSLARALTEDLPLEPRLDALRRFTRAVIAARGDVPDDERLAFEAAGYGPAHALDVVLGVATYTLSTYANRLVRAPVDEQLRPAAGR
jgi:AhpD family alkylhydroperoxidase